MQMTLDAVHRAIYRCVSGVQGTAQPSFTPRNIDLRWSLAAPLEEELQPFQVCQFESFSKCCAKLEFQGLFDRKTDHKTPLVDHTSHASGSIVFWGDFDCPQACQCSFQCPQGSAHAIAKIRCLNGCLVVNRPQMCF